ncbi:MAG: NADPH-dependent stearoyl-CoA 9-desaturase, partial [Thermoleophilaceae bacterium]|nr:NADPH-dependent stearoyl-CoA 9-desaturase [Thermoleophilaceae bacterium]
VYLFQPFYNLLLAALFEWGVATHDLDFEAIKTGEKSKQQIRRELKGMAHKGRLQITKDYIVFPLLSGLAATAVELGIASIRASRTRKSRRRRVLDAAIRRARPKAATDARGIVRELVERRSFRRPFKTTLRANVTANVVRNVWAYAIIFCGHFPDQTYTFSQEEVADETRGGFYVRQLLGAANIEGGAFFHVASGNLGYQVEHHLYPDMPSTRYAEIAPRVKDICERYDLPYNTGPFGKQLGSVQRTILRLAFPGGKPRPKPGPYRGDDTAESSANGKRREPAGPQGSGPEQETPGVRVSMPRED